MPDNPRKKEAASELVSNPMWWFIRKRNKPGPDRKIMAACKANIKKTAG